MQAGLLVWSLGTADFGWWGPTLLSSTFPFWDVRGGEQAISRAAGPSGIP